MSRLGLSAEPGWRPVAGQQGSRGRVTDQADGDEGCQGTKDGCAFEDAVQKRQEEAAGVPCSRRSQCRSGPRRSVLDSGWRQRWPNPIAFTTAGQDRGGVTAGKVGCQVFLAEADVFLATFFASFFTGAAALRAASAAAHSLVV